MTFHPVGVDAELAEGQTVCAEIAGRRIAVCRSGGALFAFDDVCPHSGARLGRGRVGKGVVSCPLHGARFELSSGACLSLQMQLPAVVTHEVRVSDGRIEVALSPVPPTPPLT